MCDTHARKSPKEVGLDCLVCCSDALRTQVGPLQKSSAFLASAASALSSISIFQLSKRKATSLGEMRSDIQLTNPTKFFPKCRGAMLPMSPSVRTVCQSDTFLANGPAMQGNSIDAQELITCRFFVLLEIRHCYRKALFDVLTLILWACVIDWICKMFLYMFLRMCGRRNCYPPYAICHLLESILSQPAHFGRAVGLAVPPRHLDLTGANAQTHCFDWEDQGQTLTRPNITGTINNNAPNLGCFNKTDSRLERNIVFYLVMLVKFGPGEFCTEPRGLRQHAINLQLINLDDVRLGPEVATDTKHTRKYPNGTCASRCPSCLTSPLDH